MKKFIDIQIKNNLGENVCNEIWDLGMQPNPSHMIFYHYFNNKIVGYDAIDV